MHLFVTDTLKEKVGVCIRKPVSIWCDRHLPHAAPKVDQAVDCDLWNVVPLFNDCEVAGNWRELEHAILHIDPEHPKHIW
jgi:hypothetical protein